MINKCFSWFSVFLFYLIDIIPSLLFEHCKKKKAIFGNHFNMIQADKNLSNLAGERHMPSFSKNCDPQKKIYDSCFTEFFPKFLSGDNNDPCTDKLDVYLQYRFSLLKLGRFKLCTRCLRSDLEKLGLNISDLNQKKLLENLGSMEKQISDSQLLLNCVVNKTYFDFPFSLFTLKAWKFFV